MNGFLLKPSDMVLVTSSTTALGYRASNIGNDRMGLVWRSETGSDNQVLTIDLGADTAVDTVTLHGLAEAQSDWTWVVALATAAQGPFTGSYWSDEPEPLLAGATMPVSGKGRALWLAPDGAPAVARYVRLSFLSLETSEAVQIGRACVGERITLGRSFTYGAALGIRPLGTVGFSARGALLRRRGARMRGVGVSLDTTTLEEAETLVMPLYERVGNDEVVCLCTDPAEHDERQNRIWLGFLQGDLGAIHAGYNRFTAAFNVLAVD